MLKSENVLYNCQQIRACEQQALTLYHLDGPELMERAGQAAINFIQTHYSHLKHIAVFCGAGNNAGDGYVFARLAHEKGLNVTIYQCKLIEDLPEPARYAGVMAIAAGVKCLWAEEPLDEDTELIIDALLGIGARGSLYGLILNTIQHINDSGLPIVALDIPSGLNADTGAIQSLCINAQKTITFIAPKAGMYTGDAVDYCGLIYCDDLNLDSSLQPLKPQAKLLHQANVGLPLTPRKKNSHKGVYGHVVAIGGGDGMPGAVALAAKAALRVGAGKVSIATWPQHVGAILTLVPEAMVKGITDLEDLNRLLEQASFCILGPGLGEDEWARSLFTRAIASQVPMLIDASALRLLAENPQVDDNWILTPHPGEAAQLLSCSARDIQANRYQSAQTLQQAYGGVVLLKGAGTIIQTVEKETFVCSLGNPGMASAGMGDVLSGIISGLAAQGLSLSEASKLGVWLHAQIGDFIAHKMGQRGLLATDFLNQLPYHLNCIL